MAENAGEGQKLDPPHGFRDSLIAKKAEDVLPCRAEAVADVIAVTEAVESRAVDLEKAQGAVDPRKFVEVDQQIKNPVQKLMPLRCESPVKHGALVKAGAERRAHQGIVPKNFFTAWAASNPALHASSWKP